MNSTKITGNLEVLVKGMLVVVDKGQLLVVREAVMLVVCKVGPEGGLAGGDSSLCGRGAATVN